MKRLRFWALCFVLAVSLGYVVHNAYVQAASASDGDKTSDTTAMTDGSRFAAGSASAVLKREVVFVSDTMDCVAPLYQRAVFSVTAQGEQLRYQWQICDPDTDRWVDISERYVGAFSVAADSTLSFAADAYTKNGLMVRCAVTDVYGNSATSSPATLRITHGYAAKISAVDFGADGTDGRDDSAAIQAALDFAGEYADAQRPVTVSLPDGSYDLANTLYISSHIRFVLSDGAELNYCGDNGCMLQGSSEGGVTGYYQMLTDVTIDGGRWNAGACVGEVPTAPIVIVDASDIHICNLDMRQSSHHFVMLAGVDNAVVSGCTFHDSLATGEETPYSREAVFVGSFRSNQWKWILSRNVTVSRCTFDGVHGGVGVRYVNENPSVHITVNRCDFRNLSASCVNADGVIGLTVSGCRVSDCGAFLYACHTGGNITGNRIEGTGERCISLTGGSVVNVADNHISQVGKCDVPARKESGSALLISDSEWQMIMDVFNRIYDRTVRYVSEIGGRQIPEINARKTAGPGRDGNSGIAVYYSDSMGSVTGNTVTNVKGQGVVTKDSMSLTVISDNVFGDVSGTSVSASGSKVAVMCNRYDNPAQSVTVEPLSDDGVKQEFYNRDEPRLSAASVVMQSDSVQAAAGQLIGFSVAAQGSGLQYQWYYRQDEGCFWSVWKGHTTASEMAVASGFWNGKQVCCVITDKDGQSVTTRPVRIRLCPSFSLTVTPDNLMVKWNTEIHFGVYTQRLFQNYEWYYRKPDDLTWTRWNTQDLRHFSVSATAERDGLEIYGSVRNINGSMLRSPAAAIAIIPPVGIRQQPGSVTVNSGDTASFSVGAYGVNLRYRWYYRASHDDGWRLWAEQTGSCAEVTADMTWNGREVRCVVYDAYGQSAVSREVTVTVRDTPMPVNNIALPGNRDDALRILSQPENAVVRLGETPTVSAEVSGSDLHWQWYFRKTSAQPWCRMAGEHASSVCLPSDMSWDGVWVRCEVKDGRGRRVISEPAQVRLLVKPAIARQPQNVNAKTGKRVVFSIEALGTGLRYQWYRRMAGDSQWTEWQNRTTPSFEETAEASWNGMQVCCVVTDRDGVRMTTEAAYVAVGNGPVITHQPEDVSVPVGGKWTLSVNAKGDGVKCQWYCRRPGKNGWTAWKKQTGFSVSAAARPAWNGMQVCCVLTDRWGHRTVSETVTVRLL